MNQAGIDLIKKFEGCKLGAYKCPAGVWTIGYGHTEGVYQDQKITQEQADSMLKSDLEKYEKQVRQLLEVPVTANQISALVSFAYNVGVGNLQKSNLLARLNSCDYLGCADQFPRWNKAGGKVLDGLTKRREAERALFLEGMK